MIEADESDGSIALYEPAFSVVTNITLDHKPVEELRPLFESFVAKAKEGAVINRDDPEASQLAGKNTHVLNFSLIDSTASFVASKIKAESGQTRFIVTDTRHDEQAKLLLPMPGRHNVENALTAIAASVLAGVDFAKAVAALADFQGVRRRLELVGRTADNITVVDDFAHNPDKIKASLAALKEMAQGRIIPIFQPHGFGPMRMMRKEIVAAFAEGLREDDMLLMPDIFYAGGTAAKDISSADIVSDITAAGATARYIPTRQAIRDFLKSEAKPGDLIVVMGARDDTLVDFARGILADMRQRGAANVRDLAV